MAVSPLILEISVDLDGVSRRSGCERHMPFGPFVLVLTMVDREEGATEAFAEAGMEFRSLYKAGEFLKG